MTRRVSAIDISELLNRTCTFTSTCDLMPFPVTGTVVRVEKNDPAESFIFLRRTESRRIYRIGTNTANLTVKTEKET